MLSHLQDYISIHDKNILSLQIDKDEYKAKVAWLDMNSEYLKEKLIKNHKSIQTVSITAVS